MPTDPLDGYPPMMTPEQVSEYLGISVDRLNAWRKASRGPVYVKVGERANGAVRYPREQLRQYIAANTVTPATVI